MGKGEITIYIIATILGFIYIYYSYELIKREKECLSHGYTSYSVGYCVDKFKSKAVRVDEVGL